MPRCFLIAAMTLCGHIGPSPFSSPEDRQHLETWRDQTDASLMGAGTLRDADPEMRGSHGVLRENRIRAFVSASGRIPLEKRRIFLHGPPPLFFTPSHVAKSLALTLGQRGGVHPVPSLQDKSLDLKAVLAVLKTQGTASLLLEGGGGLNYQALKQGIVDELLLTLCPKILGSSNAVPLVHGPCGLKETGPWHLLDYRIGNSGEVFLHYTRTADG
ncbi:RibD family protein [Desulfobotulus sp.]|uniref:RibD family protein n=1 Tax=Desulfobotulus sp. TaxID=1940337 RepID=UPI002A3714E2|nr:dihydrofolate reductase family protein [Desulfobotulus sp.]MDY0163873.1 dihydrofolate reductase family protein [Desulfobotulus sp.]